MRKVILLGDSIAKGVIRDNPSVKYYISPFSFAKNCEKAMDVQIENHAHFGSTIQKGLLSFHRHEKKISTADEVWLLFGGNDSNMDLSHLDDSASQITYQPSVDLKDFQQQYSELITSIQALGAKVTLFSLPPVALRKFIKNVQQNIGTAMGRCKWQQFVHRQPEKLANLHEMYNLSVFKLAYKHQVPVVDITTAFLKNGNCEPYFCDDGMHPNNQGHLLITNAIMKARPELVHSRPVLFCQKAGRCG